MKKLIASMFIALLVPQSSLHAQSPVIQQVIDSVRIDSLVYVVKELSGEVSTIIDDSLQTIRFRCADQPGNILAQKYIEHKLASFGLAVTTQHYSATGTNVIATQVGTMWPNRRFIISAHYDAWPSYSPGADDDASGVACVLEAARILSRYSFPVSIVYALWDEEEVAVYPCGSTYYATQALAAGDSILGVLQLEALGYDSNKDGLCMVQERPDVRSVQFCNNMMELVQQYGIHLTVRKESPTGDSDHAPFWYRGYDAAVLVHHTFSDLNPFYHTANDRINAFNTQYYLEMAKLATATLAFCASYLNFDITHTPIASVIPPHAVNTEMFIYTAMPIGTGSRAPRMYVRTKALDGDYGPFEENIGTSAGGGHFTFAIPAFPGGTVVQYYLAAQDENSTVVRTLPAGGGGFTPPGTTPPTTFYEFLVGDLSVIWSDSANSLSNWTSTGGWNITTEQCESPPTSFTDSPGGKYPTPSNAILTLKDQIPAQTARRTFLEFDTRWAIEYGHHYSQVQVSTNGGPFAFSLAGRYSYWGRYAPSWNYAYLYGGLQTTWVHEICDISDYAKSPFRFRFALVSNNWNYFEYMDGWYIDNVKISVLSLTGVNPLVDQLPTEYSLSQNYPNPFNPSTTIKYELPKALMVRLSVYDILGREVSVLVNERKNAGSYEVKFDVAGLSSGVYLYRLQAGDFVQSRKLMMLK